LLLIAFISLNLNKNYFLKEFLIWRLFVVYSTISFIIGFLFFAEIYFDYKHLVFNFLHLIIPILLGILLSRPKYFKLFYNTWLKWGIPLAVISIVFIPGYQVGKVFTAILFIGIFFKEIPIRYKLISISIILLGLVLNSGSRTVIIRSMFLVIIALSTYFPSLIKKTKQIILFSFLIPFLLFFAASVFEFNVFSLGDENTDYTIKTSVDKSGDATRSLTEDTRTFLYMESLRSAIKNDYLLFGRTPARGHDSDSFYGDGHDGTRRGERNGDEVGIVNIFNWFGIIGVVLYASCFFYSMWLGLYRSNNIFTNYGALLLQFFWIYSWVEEIQVVRWDYLIIFLIVPFITSKSFRQMNDIEMKKFIKTITIS
jgi:hypothetical protein